MSRLSRIYGVADADQVLVGIWSDRGEPRGVLVELDGRRWVVYQNLQMSTGWVTALAGPGGAPIAGSELALPCVPGEQGVPLTWWGKFRDGSDPLPEPTRHGGVEPAAVTLAVPGLAGSTEKPDRPTFITAHDRETLTTATPRADPTPPGQPQQEQQQLRLVRGDVHRRDVHRRVDPLPQTVPQQPPAPDPPPSTPARIGQPFPPSAHRTGETMTYPPISVTLTGQHDQIAALLRVVQQTSGDDRRRAFDEFSAYLAAHEAAEEEAIHPAARSGAGGVVAQRLAEEHHAGTLITALEGLDVDSAEFNAAFPRLHRAVLEHTHREERDEFPGLDTVEDTSTLIRLRYAMNRVDSLAARAVGTSRSFVDRVDLDREHLRGTADATM